MPELHIPEDAVTAIVHKVILESIGTEQRDAIFAQALSWMTKSQDSGYYGKQNVSPLQEAFQMAMREATRTVVADMIATDEEVRGFVQAELRTLVREFSRQLDADTFGELRSVLIEAMVDHLAKQRAEGRY